VPVQLAYFVRRIAVFNPTTTIGYSAFLRYLRLAAALSNLFSSSSESARPTFSRSASGLKSPQAESSTYALEDLTECARFHIGGAPAGTFSLPGPLVGFNVARFMLKTSLHQRTVSGVTHTAYAVSRCLRTIHRASLAHCSHFSAAVENSKARSSRRMPLTPSSSSRRRFSLCITSHTLARGHGRLLNLLALELE